MAEKRESRSVITPEAMLSYPHLFEPVLQEGKEKPDYSCCLVFAPGADLSKLRQVVGAAATDKWGNKAKEMYQKGQIRLPFREDGVEKGYAEGSVFINVRSQRQPGVVGPRAGMDGKPETITDPDEVYPGCFVRASLRAFAYDTNGNRGVSFALGNLQKLKDGERLDGYRRAEDEFEALESAEDEFGAPPAAPTPDPFNGLANGQADGKQQAEVLGGKPVTQPAPIPPLAPPAAAGDPFA